MREKKKIDPLNREMARIANKTNRQLLSVAEKYGEHRIPVMLHGNLTTVTKFWTERIAMSFFGIILPTDSISDLFEKMESFLEEKKCSLTLDGTARRIIMRDYIQFAIEANDFRLLILLVTRNGYDASGYENSFLKTDQEYLAWKYVDYSVMTFLEHYDRMMKVRVYNKILEMQGIERGTRKAISVETYLSFTKGMIFNKDNYLDHRVAVTKLGNWSHAMPWSLERMFARPFFLTDVTDDSAAFTVPLYVPGTGLAIDMHPYLRMGPVRTALTRIVNRKTLDIVVRGSVWKNIPLADRFVTNDDTDTTGSEYPLWLTMFEYFLVNGTMMSFNIIASKVGEAEKSLYDVEHLKRALTSQDATSIGKYIGFYPELPLSYLQTYRRFVKTNFAEVYRAAKRDVRCYVTAWSELLSRQPQSKQRNPINKTLKALKP